MFEKSYALVKLKNVPVDELQVTQNTLNEKTLFEEFQYRRCKTIIGKAWPKWVEAFQKAGGKNAIYTKESIDSIANEAAA